MFANFTSILEVQLVSGLNRRNRVDHARERVLEWYGNLAQGEGREKEEKKINHICNLLLCLVSTEHKMGVLLL